MGFNDDDSNIDGILLALVAGVGLGFGLGVLFAPNTGRKTRALIAKHADRRMDQIQRHVEDFRDTASDLVEKGRRTVKTHKETVSDALDSAKKALREAAS